MRKTDAIAAGLGVLAVAVELGSTPVSDPITWVPDLTVGLVLIATGVVVLRLGAPASSGAALLAAGGAWYIANVIVLTPFGQSGMVGWAASLAYLHRGLLLAGVLLLRDGAWPRAAAVVVILASPIPVWGPLPVMTSVWVALMLAVGGSVVSSWPARPRARAGAALGLAVASVAAVAAASLISDEPAWTPGLTALYDVGLVAAAAFTAAAAARLRARPAPVADAVIRVALAQGGPVRGLLARELGDPGLELAFTTDAGWVDELGEPRGRIQPRAERERMSIPIADVVVAELSVRADVAGDAGVVHAIEGATRLAARNALLRAALRREADGLSDSQRRLLTVQDDQRRTLGAQLTATVDAPLVALGRSFEAISRHDDPTLTAALDTCVSRAAALKDDLHHLAAGLGPSPLSTVGLDEAVLGLLTPLDLVVRQRIDVPPLTPEVATSAYLICSEAIANVVKHAHAQRIDVSISHADGILVVDVTDDGLGNADLSRGSGLRGLMDRADAFGGSLQVTSGHGVGTTVRALLPTAGQSSPSRFHGTA